MKDNDITINSVCYHDTIAYIFLEVHAYVFFQQDRAVCHLADKTSNYNRSLRVYIELLRPQLCENDFEILITEEKVCNHIKYYIPCSTSMLLLYFRIKNVGFIVIRNKEFKTKANTNFFSLLYFFIYTYELFLVY